MTRWIIRETIRDSYFAHLCIHLIAPAVCGVSFEYGVFAITDCNASQSADYNRIATS
jgi:hypothetical protein